MEWLCLFLVLIFLAIALIYNRLIRNRNRVDAAWSDIDVQLKRRYNLIPQLLAAVKQYASYEQKTLEAIASLRTVAQAEMQPDIKAPLDIKLNEEVLRLVAVVEDYPDLKANENFIQLQRDLVDIETYIEKSRRFYNGSVREFNTSLNIFPNNIVARLFGFSDRKFYAIDK